MSKKNKLLTSRIVGVLVASMFSMGLSGQMPAKRPSLVIGIVVDGLSLDHLNLLKGYFGPDGFNRLMDKGVTVTDIDFGSALDPAAATALLFTGASPSINGIASANTYDRVSRRTAPVYLDAATIGNYTDETLSPKALRVSTIGDEVKIATGGLGHVYSLAPRREQALAMAGHAGNSGFWINDITGKWSTSTFYKDVPTSIQSRNHLQPLEIKLDTITWTSLLNPEDYPDMPSYKKYFSFRHIFPRNEADRFKRFIDSPIANREVTDVATDYLKSMRLGKGENFDMLNISYTLSPYLYGKENDSRMELMDSYLRLDKDLAKLFKSIETSGPGMENTLVFLAGTPATVVGRREDDKWALSAGDFSPRRAISLLNIYLIALHGNGNWIAGYHDSKFYLNHDLIKERDIDLRQIRKESADFITRMTGIAEALSIDDIIDGKSAETAMIPRRNIDIETGGDVYFTIIPGWEIIDDGTTAPLAPTFQKTQRLSAATAPAFILSPTLTPAVITNPVDARIIAPTITSLLRIRSPNAAQLPPLRLNQR